MTKEKRWDELFKNVKVTHPLEMETYLQKRAIAKQIFDEIFQDILESPEQENWKKLPIIQKYLKLLYKDFEKLKSKYLDCK